MNYRLPIFRVLALLAMTFSLHLDNAAIGADDGGGAPQYVYKTVGERQLKADIFYPDDWTTSDRRAAIVFYSGGAWRTGGTEQFLPQAQYFANRGAVTVRAEYRDSTKDKVNPDTCLKDAICAMRWVRKNADRLGVDPDRIVSSGGSAGGYLAAAVATIDDFHSADDDLSVSPKPNAMILFNPVLDFVTLDRAPEFGIVGELAQRISPLQHVTKEVPPTLILIGSKDRFLEKNKQFVTRAKQLGVRAELDLAEGQPHAYFNHSPWLEKTVASADRFLISLGYLSQEPRVELPSSSPRTQRTSLRLQLRRRVETTKDSGLHGVETRRVQWNPNKTAIIICDMWDDHTCKGAAGRVAEMAPAIDRTVKAARQQGVFIIHAPSGCMSVYRDTPQRSRAVEAEFVKAGVEIKWNHWNEEREGEPLAAIVDDGCSCAEPCPNFHVDDAGVRSWVRGGKIPWTRQISTIEIASHDAISDNGQEIYNLLEARGIDNVIVMGVHTNICVSGRPFGLRQMVYFGMKVVLCRDLTDALFQSPSAGIDQFRGTELVVEHIEKHICPTITSESITGQAAFRFKGDVGTADER
jgi:acetyl esterase/lipase/nicotinamidase-related amidase